MGSASRYGETEAQTAEESDDDKNDQDIVDMINNEEKFQEWSLPIKFIIKQKDFVIGKEFKKQE